jgi:hypothetical protein
MICIERLAQTVSDLFCLELQQYAVKQCKLLAVHTVNFLVQKRLELFRLHWRGCLAAFHAGTIRSSNKAGKRRQAGVQVGKATETAGESYGRLASSALLRLTLATLFAK